MCVTDLEFCDSLYDHDNMVAQDILLFKSAIRIGLVHLSHVSLLCEVLTLFHVHESRIY